MINSPSDSFPDKNDLAHILFQEGIRHLEDAYILHEAQRYAAAIASAMKAAEMGIKTMIVLGNALGWWDKIFTTHSPLTDIKALPTFQSHIKILEGYSRSLIVDVVELESLPPIRPGGNYDINTQKNPEYPFLSFLSFNPVTNTGGFRLDAPSSYFFDADSQKYFNTAQDLLTAITVHYAIVHNWKLVIPASI